MLDELSYIVDQKNLKTDETQWLFKHSKRNVISLDDDEWNSEDQEFHDEETKSQVRLQLKKNKTRSVSRANHPAPAGSESSQ